MSHRNQPPRELRNLRTLPELLLSNTQKTCLKLKARGKFNQVALHRQKLNKKSGPPNLAQLYDIITPNKNLREIVKNVIRLDK